MFRYVSVLSVALATYGLPPCASEGARYAPLVARREEDTRVCIPASPVPVLQGTAHDRALAGRYPYTSPSLLWCPRSSSPSPSPSLQDILKRRANAIRDAPQGVKPYFGPRQRRRPDPHHGFFI